MNILFVPHNKKEIRPAYILKYNHDGKRWHYLAVRILSALLRGIASSSNKDFYCLNCFHSYRTHNKLKKHERVCNNHDYCRVDMPTVNEKNKVFIWRKVVYADVYLKNAILSK